MILENYSKINPILVIFKDDEKKHYYIEPKQTITVDINNKGTTYVSCLDIDENVFWEGFMITNCNSPIKIDIEKKKIFYSGCQIPAFQNDKYNINYILYIIFIIITILLIILFFKNENLRFFLI